MATLQYIPSDTDLRELIGEQSLATWKNFCSEIESVYDIEHQWNEGGKKWDYEYKYRHGSKTLCALYARKNCFGFMIIFGKDEREKFEAIKDGFAEHTVELYDNAQTYHDGKWVMFDEKFPLEDMRLLLEIKRKPNKDTQK